MLSSHVIPVVFGLYIACCSCCIAEEETKGANEVAQIVSPLVRLAVDWGSNVSTGEISFWGGRSSALAGHYLIVVTAVKTSPIELGIVVSNEDGFLRAIDKCGCYSNTGSLVLVKYDGEKPLRVKIVKLLEK